MKVSVCNWDGKAVSEMNLQDEVFGVPVREDILARVVHWQLAKRRSGNHKTKEIGDVSGTTRKPHRQKGTGRARQGSLRSPQFRGGAVIFGPVVRDHGYDLPKKVRRLGLKCALSARMAQGRLIVVEDLVMTSGKTKAVADRFSGKTLMIGGDVLCPHLQRAVSNLHHVNFLPRQGLNVYDILRHEHLMMSKDAVAQVQQWLAS